MRQFVLQVLLPVAIAASAPAQTQGPALTVHAAAIKRAALFYAWQPDEPSMYGGEDSCYCD